MNRGVNSKILQEVAAALEGSVAPSDLKEQTTPTPLWFLLSCNENRVYTAGIFLSFVAHKLVFKSPLQLDSFEL